jgi:ribosome-interacting GTPase 1
LHEALEDEDVLVEKHKQVRVIKTNDSNGVTIISGDEIDGDTRAKLEKVLKEAGKDGEILFLDDSELSGDEQAHGKHEVRIIKKKIDVTN